MVKNSILQRMISALTASYAFLYSSRYVLIFLGCFAEGAGVMAATGVLLRLGKVELVPAFVTLLAADLSADVMWYFVGRFGAREVLKKRGTFLGVTREVFEKIEVRFHRYHSPFLLLSKVTSGMGFAYATLVVAGMVRIPLGRFVALNLIGGTIWISMMMALGYYFGNVIEQIPLWAQVGFGILAIGALLVGLRSASRYLADSQW